MLDAVGYGLESRGFTSCEAMSVLVTLLPTFTNLLKRTQSSCVTEEKELCSWDAVKSGMSYILYLLLRKFFKIAEYRAYGLEVSRRAGVFELE
jgi:hypothetical protein